jgi:(5-formylfuran-3-yl)methyl phosphate synthase
MRLLVSARNAADAAAALAGGADILDAKEPSAGALGAVTIETLREMLSTVDACCPVSAALGDAEDAAALERRVYACAVEGVAFVKIGFAGITDAARVTDLIASAVGGARAHACAVVAVGYADVARVGGIACDALFDAATRGGAAGVLIDTADKAGPGLLQLSPPATLRRYVSAAHDRGLSIAMAGKLSSADLAAVRDVGADIAGVRGAACHAGRESAISEARVRVLAQIARGEQTVDLVSGHTR